MYHLAMTWSFDVATYAGPFISPHQAFGSVLRRMSSKVRGWDMDLWRAREGHIRIYKYREFDLIVRPIVVNSLTERLTTNVCFEDKATHY